MERVRVAVGVICQGQELLLSKRRQDAHQGGLWEFPGGKIESGETASTALHRELQEELGIQVQCSEPLLEVRYDYADRQVLLEARWVSQFTGQVLPGGDNRYAGSLPRNCSKSTFPPPIGPSWRRR